MLVQECIRYNKLIDVMERSLPELQKALKGLVVMSGELEAVGKAIALNTVPQAWEAKVRSYIHVYRTKRCGQVPGLLCPSFSLRPSHAPRPSGGNTRDRPGTHSPFKSGYGREQVAEEPSMVELSATRERPIGWLGQTSSPSGRFSP